MVQLDATEATISALRREVNALRSENNYLRDCTLAGAAEAGLQLPAGGDSQQDVSALTDISDSAAAAKGGSAPTSEGEDTATLDPLSASAAAGTGAPGRIRSSQAYRVNRPRLRCRL